MLVHTDARHVSAWIPVKHAPVVTCAEAARARRIPLSQELKTLILHGDRRWVIAVHLPATRRLQTSRIRRLLNARDVRFASEAWLEKRSLAPGLINPWNTPRGSYHFICLSVFREQLIATNDGTFSGGILFDPRMLLTLPRLVIGRFGIQRYA
jgi:prolyl-tRNA editing enzyme YbaK/EbsC (Cys-tRNA(Pro) deacylase)